MSRIWHERESNANGFPENDEVVSYINKKIFYQWKGIFKVS